MRVTLLCHGATPSTWLARFPLDDEALDPKGRAVIGVRPPPVPASARPGGVGLCLTSPARRARETADALGLQCTPEAALRDLDMGRWAGRTLADLEGAAPSDLLAWLSDPAAAPHGGEPVTALLGRVGGWLDGLDPAAPVLAVTHPAVLRAAAVHALGTGPAAFWRIDIAPLAVMTLGGQPGRWQLAGRVPR